MVIFMEERNSAFRGRSSALSGTRVRGAETRVCIRWSDAQSQASQAIGSSPPACHVTKALPSGLTLPTERLSDGDLSLPPSVTAVFGQPFN